MAYNLLGMFQPQQSQMQTLLGEYYDPKAARMAWLGGALQAAGAGLASGRPGAWAEGLALGGGQGNENYRRRALVEYGIKNQQDQQAKADQRYQTEWDYRVGQDEEARKRQAKADAMAMTEFGWKVEDREKPPEPNIQFVTPGSSMYVDGQYKETVPKLPEEQKPPIDDPMRISKDYQSQPGFQRLKEVAPTIQSMVKSLDDPSAMADLDFVYGLAKILDPTSVVRESEAGMVIDSQGIAPSLLGQLNKIMTGQQAMLPETRKTLVGVAMRRAKEFEAQAQQERGFYGNMAKESGYNPDTYLQPVPIIPGIPTDQDGWQTLPNGTRIRQKGN